jgi:hypothetical protein
MRSLFSIKKLGSDFRKLPFWKLEIFSWTLNRNISFYKTDCTFTVRISDKLQIVIPSMKGFWNNDTSDINRRLCSKWDTEGEAREIHCVSVKNRSWGLDADCFQLHHDRILMCCTVLQHLKPVDMSLPLKNGSFIAVPRILLPHFTRSLIRYGRTEISVPAM